MAPARQLAGRASSSARPAHSKRRYELSGAIEAMRTALQVGPLSRIGRFWLYAPKRMTYLKRRRRFAHETAEHLIRLGEAERIGNLLFRRIVTVFVAFIMWSSVMSQSANAHRFTPTEWEFRHLSPEKVRQIETSGRPPKHIPRTIDIRTIPPAAQAAFISLSLHPLCQTMTQVLRSSSVRFNVHDFAVLRQIGLVERAEGNRWHRLTEDGKAYAHQVAQQIATEMGLHKIWTASGGAKFYRTVHCTCGWTTRLYSERFDAGKDHQHRIARHLAEASGAIGRPGG